MAILAWIAIGLIAGAVARLLVPGHDPIGCLGTIAVGLAGSLVGGAIGDLLTPGHQRFEPAGIIGSIVGAVIVLAVLRWSSRRHRWGRWGRRLF